LIQQALAANLAQSFAMDTSVDFTSATTSEPMARFSSSTERVVMTEVTMPQGVSTSTSETTSPLMISRTLPLNWLRTLMAWMDMVFSFWWEREGNSDGPAQGVGGWGGPDRFVRWRCAVGHLQHAVQDAFLDRGERGIATRARACQRHALVQRDGAVFDQDHAVGQGYRFLHVV